MCPIEDLLQFDSLFSISERVLTMDEKDIKNDIEEAIQFINSSLSQEMVTKYTSIIYNLLRATDVKNMQIPLITPKVTLPKCSLVKIAFCNGIITKEGISKTIEVTKPNEIYGICGNIFSNNTNSDVSELIVVVKEQLRRDDLSQEQFTLLISHSLLLPIKDDDDEFTSLAKEKIGKLLEKPIQSADVFRNLEFILGQRYDLVQPFAKQIVESAGNVLGSNDPDILTSALSIINMIIQQLNYSDPLPYEDIHKIMSYGEGRFSEDTPESMARELAVYLKTMKHVNVDLTYPEKSFKELTRDQIITLNILHGTAPGFLRENDGVEKMSAEFTKEMLSSKNPDYGIIATSIATINDDNMLAKLMFDKSFPYHIRHSIAAILDTLMPFYLDKPTPDYRIFFEYIKSATSNEFLEEALDILVKDIYLGKRELDDNEIEILKEVYETLIKSDNNLIRAYGIEIHTYYTRLTSTKSQMNSRMNPIIKQIITSFSEETIVPLSRAIVALLREMRDDAFYKFQKILSQTIHLVSQPFKCCYVECSCRPPLGYKSAYGLKGTLSKIVSERELKVYKGCWEIITGSLKLSNAQFTMICKSALNAYFSFSKVESPHNFVYVCHDFRMFIDRLGQLNKRLKPILNDIIKFFDSLDDHSFILFAESYEPPEDMMKEARAPLAKVFIKRFYHILERRDVGDNSIYIPMYFRHACVIAPTIAKNEFDPKIGSIMESLEGTRMQASLYAQYMLINGSEELVKTKLMDFVREEFQKGDRESIDTIDELRFFFENSKLKFSRETLQMYFDFVADQYHPTGDPSDNRHWETIGDFLRALMGKYAVVATPKNVIYYVDNYFSEHYFTFEDEVPLLIKCLKEADPKEIDFPKLFHKIVKKANDNESENVPMPLFEFLINYLAEHPALLTETLEVVELGAEMDEEDGEEEEDNLYTLEMTILDAARHIREKRRM